MRFSTRNAVFAGLLATGLLTLAMNSAKAQGYYGGGGYGQGYYGGGGYGQGYSGGGGYGQGYYGGGGYGQGYYGGGGYAVPSYNYYGNGGHDFQPHWHTKQTPIGNFSYYGQGAHDFRPHAHTETSYGITSFNGGYFSNTQSYSPPAPFIYRPW